MLYHYYAVAKTVILSSPFQPVNPLLNQPIPVEVSFYKFHMYILPVILKDKGKDYC